MSTPKKIYIAGPAVFQPDFGKAHFDRVRAMLAEKNVQALIPVDEVAHGALDIRNKNIALIQKCDAIIADLSPFRSHESDCGTAFELGYAAALGKILITFTSDKQTLVEKYGGDKDADGNTVEDFQLPFNLMLADNECPIFESFDEAFEHFCEKHNN